MGFFSKKPYLSLHSLRFLAPTPLTETLHALYAMFGYGKAIARVSMTSTLLER
jgi:hypothetical protein